MPREAERLRRAAEEPIVGGLPEVPGIRVAMQLTPGLGVHMRGLADELLVHDYPGATIRRHEREMLATAVSAANDCFFCMDSHAAHARALMEREGAMELAPMLDVIREGSSDGLDEKMTALVHIARTVQAAPLRLTRADVDAATAAGASDGDVQLAVLIAAAFSMYNRYVDGLGTFAPGDPAAYLEGAHRLVNDGYAPSR